MSLVSEYLENLNEISRHDALFRALIKEVSMWEYRVLYLVRKKPLHLNAISSTRLIAQQGVGRMCERLRKRGLLDIQRDPRDKRAKLVQLTTKGAILTKKCEKALKKTIR